ncbi:hypothetical protein DERP_006069 [Dermatophagoides pteronyssinus]|uniref:Uncharacterized protein n=1 Tax=Dermatophagoides pteronyssinus TaxID=6956 RepID=A0ABQ8JS82_DERPT|nr:hypothetical protein DERP_006069 [Dermatophagoides pteronyssinus]
MLRKIVEKILNIEIVGSFDQQSRLTDDHTLLGYESNKQSNSSIGFIISEKYYLDFQPINGNRKFIINRPPFITVQNSILEPSTILTSKKLQADENDENNLNQTKQKSNGLKFKIRRIYQIDLTNPGSFSYGKYEIINLTDENVNDSNGNLEQEIIQIEESGENVNDSNGKIEQEVILIDESDDYSNIEQESLSSSSSSYGKSKKMKLNNKPIYKLAKNNTESIPVITLDSDSD